MRLNKYDMLYVTYSIELDSKKSNIFAYLRAVDSCLYLVKHVFSDISIAPFKILKENSHLPRKVNEIYLPPFADIGPVDYTLITINVLVFPEYICRPKIIILGV